MKAAAVAVAVAVAASNHGRCQVYALRERLLPALSLLASSQREAATAAAEAAEAAAAQAAETASAAARVPKSCGPAKSKVW